MLGASVIARGHVTLALRWHLRPKQGGWRRVAVAHYLRQTRLLRWPQTSADERNAPTTRQRPAETRTPPCNGRQTRDDRDREVPMIPSRANRNHNATGIGPWLSSPQTHLAEGFPVTELGCRLDGGKTKTGCCSEQSGTRAKRNWRRRATVAWHDGRHPSLYALPSMGHWIGRARLIRKPLAVFTDHQFPASACKAKTDAASHTQVEKPVRRPF